MQTTTATFTKSVEMQFERIGKRTKLVGFTGTLTDESGIVLHSQLYDSKPEAEQALDALVHELLIDYAERGLVDTVPVDICALCECSPCHCETVYTFAADAPITIGQRFTHFGFGTGTVIAITDDEHLNVQVKFDSPSRFGSKFWFDTSEIVRAQADDLPGIENEPPEAPVWPAPGGRAVTLQSLAVESRIKRCKNCDGPHFGWQCPEIGDRLFAPETAPWYDIDLGKELCWMVWHRYRAFITLLMSVPSDQLIIYAASYQAFMRSYNPQSDLTITQILEKWSRWMRGDRGPAAMQVAA